MELGDGANNKNSGCGGGSGQWPKCYVAVRIFLVVKEIDLV